MNIAMSLVAPAILALAAVYGLHRQVDVFDALKTGAYEGLLIDENPADSRGAPYGRVYAPRLRGAGRTHGPSRSGPAVSGNSAETALIFIRPVSGSGALAVGSELITQNGADSLVGRTAAVMLGSTETTFYVIAVYFGAAGIKKSRYTIPAALTADLAGYIAASLAVRLLYK